MLAYRHSFHAGNHADVLKHLVELALLEHFVAKDKPFTYIDTHSGAGSYSLSDRHARQNAEADGGIQRLWQSAKPPELVAAYLKAVAKLNPDGYTKPVKYYPGSPALAMQMARAQDQLCLFELHSTDFSLLERFVTGQRNVRLFDEDGLTAAKKLLPNPARRALLFVDPSYELPQDYLRVPDMVDEALERMNSTVVLVWYPRLARSESVRMVKKLLKRAPPSWLHCYLDVAGATPKGMFGSGLFIANPPWNLPDRLAQTLPYLQQQLAVSGVGQYDLQYEIP